MTWKCIILSFNKCLAKVPYNYKMYDAVLGREGKFKDLGVTFNVRMSFTYSELGTLEVLGFVNSKYFSSNYIVYIVQRIYY